MNADIIATLKLITRTAWSRGAVNSGDYAYIMTALYYGNVPKAIEAMKLVSGLQSDLEGFVPCATAAA